MNAHSTGTTLALTLALALGLSFAPIPDVFRPFPALTTESPAAVISRLLLPPRSDVHAPDAITGAPDTPVALDEPELVEPAPADQTEETGETLASAPSSSTARFYAGLPSFEVRRARALEMGVERIGARHVEIEEGCHTSLANGTCVRRALDDYFDRLEALRRGERELPVRIVHLGDSQIASDYITDLVRRRLELRYGSSGPGFLFVDRPTPSSGRKVRTGEASEGWEIVKVTHQKNPGPVGFSGVRFTARGAGERTRYEVGRARIAEVVFVTSPAGGTLEISGDGRPISRLLTRFDEESLAFSRMRLPAGTKTLTAQADGGEVSLLGMTLESATPGVVYDTVGLPGAMFEVFLRAPERAFAAQLARRDPALVIVMLGGNEAYKIGRGWHTLDQARTQAKSLLQRIRSAAPEASCLLLAPMDAGVRDVAGAILPRAHTREVGSVIRQVALEGGCAFWDMLAAMGGEGAAARWYQQELFHGDLVHPRRRGADILGHLFDVALERARQSRPGTPVEPMEPTELEGASGASFARLFAGLRAHKSGTAHQPVSILHLGEGMFSTEAFSSRVRSRLSAAFPAPGRAPRFESLSLPESAPAEGPQGGQWMEIGRAGAPDLLVLALAAPDGATETDADLRARYASTVSSMRSAVPDAACLLIGPADRLRSLPGGAVVPAEAVEVATRLLRELAATHGCAFWSARAAMGGRGAMRRWQSLDPPLGDASGVGLTGAGVNAVAEAFAEDLLNSWRAWIASGETSAEAGNGTAGGAR